MSETPQDPTPDNVPAQESGDVLPAAVPRETAGDILRKERVSRRVAVETIAKDLRLNVGYIKSLEANDYDALPAEPYVRVYLRSLANYLMLDPDEIMRHYCEDRGIPPDQHERERADTLTIRVSDRERPSISWIAVAAVIGVLIILSLIANKAGWISGGTPGESGVAVDSTAAGTGSVAKDSLEAPAIPVGEPIEDSLIDTTDTAASAEGEKTSPLAERRDSLELVMTAVRDSVWAQVFADGTTWKNFLKGGESRVIRAADSINVHVGHNSILRYSLNGTPLEVKGKGVVYFRLAHDDLSYWRHGKWQRIFRGRL